MVGRLSVGQQSPGYSDGAGSGEGDVDPCIAVSVLRIAESLSKEGLQYGYEASGVFSSVDAVPKRRKVMQIPCDDTSLASVPNPVTPFHDLEVGVWRAGWHFGQALGYSWAMFTVLQLESFGG